MNTAEYVDNLIATLKQQGIPLTDVAWQAALACVGWPYVFGDRGQLCTPGNRRVAYNRTSAGKNKDNIKAKCKNFDGSGSCSGCKWYPGEKRVRDFDCRGFTYWILLQVFNWKLMGAGATSQWNNKDNWIAKGRIADGIPKDTLVCLFYSKDGKEKTWEHTGLCLNGETVECGAGVTHSSTINKKWTHWAIPKCVQVGDIVLIDAGKDEAGVATLKSGSKGTAVRELQTLLNDNGYSCGNVDGIFGKKTEAAVKAFQVVKGLPVTGIADATLISMLKDNVPVIEVPKDKIDVGSIMATINVIRQELNSLEAMVNGISA